LHTNKIAGLDGYRFLAFCCVLLCHTLPKSSENEIISFFLLLFHKNGIIGMQFFFFLSAFLLYFLYLKNKNQPFYFAAFIKRRAFRILPLYCFILILGFVVYPFVAKSTGQSIHLPSFLPFMAFFQNYYFGESIEHQHIVFFLLITWSIAVEVQFYVFLGLVLRYFEKYLIYIAFFLFVASGCFKIYAQLNSIGFYFNTLTYLGDFGAGIIFAHYWFYQPEKSNRPKPKRSYYVLFFVNIALMLFWNSIFSESKLLMFNIIFFPFMYCWLLFHQLHPAITSYTFANQSFLEEMGKISYGLYLYHGIVISVLIFLSSFLSIPQLGIGSNFYTPLLVFALSTPLSMLSYKYLELPFLRKK
jgi:peptidoglycan/LPS O-acetylase OafA/YrhL